MVIDLFPDPPPPPVVGGNIYVSPATSFPTLLEQPTGSLKPATVTPFPDIAATFLAPLEQGDLLAALLLGVGLTLGPDFLLAPAGLVSNEGIRPGFALESLVGEVLTPDAQWLKDRRERLAAEVPLQVRAVTLLPFLAAGLLLNRLLLVALEDEGFVISTGIIACFGGGVLEVLREPRPTREERDLENTLRSEFFAFSSDRIVVGGVCHERDIVREFRRFYPRYRSRDMSRTDDGISVRDDSIGDVIRWWNVQMGRPAVRSSTGYWKGVSIAPRKTPQ